MPTLLRHDGLAFEDRTVYLTGGAFFGCQFRRCTVVLKGLPFHLDNCTFGGCVWHLDLVIHDRDALAGLMAVLDGPVRSSLPSAPPPHPPADWGPPPAAEGNGGPPPGPVLDS